MAVVDGIVPMVTAFQNLQTQEVQTFVPIMSIWMEQNDMWRTVMFKRLQVLKHVKNIKDNGIDMFNVIDSTHRLVQEEC